MGQKELKKIYIDAYNDGIWLREWGPAQGGTGYMAAAGSVAKLQETEKKLGKDIDNTILEIADCMALGALPGVGATREKACLDAIRAYKEHHKIK